MQLGQAENYSFRITGSGVFRAGAFISRRACMSVAFFLAFFLLGIGDASAGDKELISIDFRGADTAVSTFYRAFPGQEAYRFEFDGVTYRVLNVSSGGERVTLEISPEFPPYGQLWKKFDLHTTFTNASGAESTIAT